MNEEERAIKWLEKNTKNYKLKSEELHYILVLFNLINNLKNENQKYKEAISKLRELHHEFAIKNSMLVFENNNLIDFMNSLINTLKEVEHE